MLNPENLPRYDAWRYPASPALVHLVEHFWSVRWSFPPGVSYDQQILQSPYVTIEEESRVPDRRFIVTELYRRAWVRTLSGDGSAFGIRFRPAGFRLLTGLDPRDFLDATIPIPTAAPASFQAALDRIAAEGTTERTRENRLGTCVPQVIQLAPNELGHRIQSRIEERLDARRDPAVGQ